MNTSSIRRTAAATAAATATTAAVVAGGAALAIVTMAPAASAAAHASTPKIPGADLVLSATTATSPLTLVDSDDISIDGGHSDFYGSPISGRRGPGNVSYYVGSGVVRAVPNGRVYQDNLPGHCVRTIARYERSNGSHLGSGIVGELCSTSPGMVAGPVVKHTFQHADLAQVRLRTQVQLSNGAWSTTNSALSKLDD